jgi:hypothetical protein
LLELDPTREAAARVLMQIHVERGESAQALRLFEALRERLQSDLGAKPEQQTLETYESIRSGRLRAPEAKSIPRANPSRATQATSVPDLLGKPSIAVLQFENMSVRMSLIGVPSATPDNDPPTTVKIAVMASEAARIACPPTVRSRSTCSPAGCRDSRPVACRECQ